MRASTTRALAAAAALLALGGVAGCGGDGSGAGPPSADSWRDRASQFCRDGLQEAAALTPPESTAELAPDAAARAEIVANVRDSLLTLGQPDDLDPTELSSYVDHLGADVDLLGRISDAAAAGEDTRELTAQLDESSGQLAAGLGLTDCAALANAIARTP